MRRAASVIVTEPVRFTDDEVMQMATAAMTLHRTLIVQPPGWRGMVAGDVLTLFKLVNAAIRRGKPVEQNGRTV